MNIKTFLSTNFPNFNVLSIKDYTKKKNSIFIVDLQSTKGIEQIVVKQSLLNPSITKNEYLSINYLSSLGFKDCVPKIITYDSKKSIIVEEFIKNLEKNKITELVDSSNQNIAENALLAYTKFLAEIHYKSLANLPNFSVNKHNNYQISITQHSIKKLLKNFLTPILSISLIEFELNKLNDSLYKNSKYLGFTHGDICLSNVLYDKNILIFDFESSGCRNIFLDLGNLSFRLLFCNSGQRMPLKLIEKLDLTYFRNLSENLKLEQYEYKKMMSFSTLAWISNWYDQMIKLKNNDIIKGSSSMRQRMLFGIKYFLNYSKEILELKHIREQLKNELKFMQNKWNYKEELDLYRCFKH